MKKYIILSIAILSTGIAIAQKEANMFFLDNVMQSSYSNPMAIPEHKLSIGLPGVSSIYAEVLHPSFSFGDLHNSKDWLVDDALDNKLKDKNLIGFSNYIDLFSIRFKAGNNFISFTNTLKTDFTFTYPGDMMRMAWRGNDSQESFDFSGLGFGTSIYSEHGIGLTFEKKKWTFGGKIKAYNGIANIKMRADDFTLQFKNGELDNYDALINNNARVLISGIPGELNLDSLKNGGYYLTDGTSVEDAFENTYGTGGSLPVFKNFGLGIDFGATYHFSEKIDLFASITDLGYIKWKENVYEYNTSFDFGYDGFDFELLKLLDDSTGEYSDSLTEVLKDSLLDSFTYNGEAKSYITSPVFRFYIGGKYKLYERTHINALLNLSINRGVRAAFTLGVYQEIHRIINLSVTNTFQYGKWMNIGFGLVIKPGPFQFYVASDNISSLLYRQVSPDGSVVIPHKLNQFNLRVGMNLVFGRNKVQEKLQGIID